jgi:Uma2 family endonuclease
MSTLAQRKMTVDEFLAWAEGREGRWELYNGKAGLPCHVLGDGAGVRISPHVMHGPDCLVYCSPELPDDALEVSSPVIVVEVVSPSTRKFDETVKKGGYFGLPSVHHYLIVDPEGPPIVHHGRQPDGTILRLEVHDGTLALSPPGIEVGVAELLEVQL